MRHRHDTTVANWFTFALILLCLAVLLTLPLISVRAESNAQYLPCATIKCLDERMVAILSRQDKLENEIRLAGEASRQARDFDTRRIEDIAWQKSVDALGLFKTQSTSYQDKFLYDTIYNRLRLHVCRMGIPHNETVRCP